MCELVCGEPVQLHYINDASPDWEAGDGAHTRRGVHGILELTTGCVCASWFAVNQYSCT